MILVTGGSGFVGLNVAEQFAARGEAVVLFDLSLPPADFRWSRTATTSSRAWSCE